MLYIPCFLAPFSGQLWCLHLREYVFQRFLKIILIFFRPGISESVDTDSMDKGVLTVNPNLAGFPREVLFHPKLGSGGHIKERKKSFPLAVLTDCVLARQLLCTGSSDHPRPNQCEWICCMKKQELQQQRGNLLLLGGGFWVDSHFHFALYDQRRASTQNLQPFLVFPLV